MTSSFLSFLSSSRLRQEVTQRKTEKTVGSQESAVENSERKRRREDNGPTSNVERQ